MRIFGMILDESRGAILGARAAVHKSLDRMTAIRTAERNGGSRELLRRPRFG
jgi:hypothetical protein